MGLTNFPNGISSFGVPVLPAVGGGAASGNVFWVDSSGSSGPGGTFKNPFPTLALAFDRCTANNGDVIYVKEGHSETFSAADGTDFDVAGVSVIGLGRGALRPKLIFDTAATADMNISAANIFFSNFVLEAGFADIVRAIQVTAANVWLDQLEFVDQAAAENWLTPIKATGTTDNEADGLTVTSCKWTSADAAGLEFIEINADLARLTVRNNYVAHEGTASPLVLVATGKDIPYHDIRDNFLSHKMTANELLVNCDTAVNPGIIAHNRVGHADVTTTHDLGIDALGSRLFDNLSVSTDSLSGFVLPAIDTDA